MKQSSLKRKNASRRKPIAKTKAVRRTAQPSFEIKFGTDGWRGKIAEEFQEMHFESLMEL